MDEKEYSYSDVCRGRYLCRDHGGFCDGADNYIQKCVLCDESDTGARNWAVNPVDRALHLVNGLQKRSQRNAALVSTLLAGIGALSILPTLLGPSRIGLYETILKLINPIWFQISVALLLVSVGLYSASMRHLKIVVAGKIPTRTLRVWEEDISKKLGELETWHKFAGIAFVLAVVALVFAVMAPLARDSIVCVIAECGDDT